MAHMLSQQQPNSSPLDRSAANSLMPPLQTGAQETVNVGNHRNSTSSSLILPPIPQNTVTSPGNLLSPPEAIMATAHVTPVATGGTNITRNSLDGDESSLLLMRQQQLMLYSHPIDSDRFCLTENLKKVISEVMNILVLPGTKFLPREKKSENGDLVFPSLGRPDLTSGKFPLPELILKECGKWQGDLAMTTYWWRVIYPEVVNRVKQDRNRIQSYMKEDIIAELKKSRDEEEVTSFKSRYNQYLHKLIESHGKGEEEFIEELHSDANIYKAFVHFALAASKKRGFWKRNKGKVPPKIMFTEIEEAFVILCLENALDVWTAIANDVDKTNLPKFKYTATGKGKGKGSGRSWTKEGMKRFNKLIELVKEMRETEFYIKMNQEIIQEYNPIDTVGGRILNNQVENIENDSDDESVEPYSAIPFSMV